jgi:DNA repair protein RecO (recombination protein O)
MLQKTRGIVIGHVPFRETSIIVRIYTEAFGMQSYIENGVRSSKGRNKAALFQPLTLLDLVVYHKDRGGVQRIGEVRCNWPFRSLPFDIAKSSLALFMTEVLGKVLKEETSNELLFAFLQQGIQWLDFAERHTDTFHLVFLMKLSSYLGFAPQSGNEIAEQLSEAGWPQAIERQVVEVLTGLTHADYETAPKLDRLTRSRTLDVLLKFYQLHVDGFGELKSLAVLQEVLR